MSSAGPERAETPAFLAALRAALARGLPGASAQDLARPAFRPRLDAGVARVAGFRPAAVLVLLYPYEGEIRFVLVRRPDSMRSHPGQIALPGGALEAGESPEEAAFREAAEELGVAPEGVEPLGRLSPLAVEPSRFLVTPVLGWSAARPDFAPSPEEVDEFHEPSLAELAAAELRAVRLFAAGRELEAPAMRLAGAEVWGATAMILCELAALLRGSGPQ